MKTWFIILGINLALPVAMIVLGFWLRHNPPQYGSRMGYCTPMARKNEDTWKHAQFCAGTYFGDWGKLTVVVAVVPMLVMLYSMGKYLIQAAVIIFVLELIAFLVVFPVTENALNTIFEKDGKRKIPSSVEM